MKANTNREKFFSELGKVFEARLEFCERAFVGLGAAKNLENIFKILEADAQFSVVAYCEDLKPLALLQKKTEVAERSLIIFWDELIKKGVL